MIVAPHAHALLLFVRAPLPDRAAGSESRFRAVTAWRFAHGSIRRDAHKWARAARQAQLAIYSSLVPRAARCTVPRATSQDPMVERISA